jgi:putative endonuclease
VAGPPVSEKQEQGRTGKNRAGHLQRHGLTLVEANFRCKGARSTSSCATATWRWCSSRCASAPTGRGGAAASITPAKIRRLVRAAQVYLQRFPRLPPCRFDVVAIDGGQLEWLRERHRMPELSLIEV